MYNIIYFNFFVNMMTSNTILLVTRIIVIIFKSPSITQGNLEYPIKNMDNLSIVLTPCSTQEAISIHSRLQAHIYLNIVDVDVITFVDKKKKTNHIRRD